MNTVRYINIKYNGVVETVDEFPYNTRQDRKYLREMLHEYSMVNPGHYISQRATIEWNEKGATG